ncbi:MAG TPA: hypothetical protein VF768_01605 [Holophagaceae bacterium]
MNPLESLLRDALQRQDPPEGFAARVLQRAQQAPRRRQPPRWLMAASILGLLVPAGLGYHLYQVRQRAEAARAQAQLLLALQITHQKLDLAFRHLQTEPE